MSIKELIPEFIFVTLAAAAILVTGACSLEVTEPDVHCWYEDQQYQDCFSWYRDGTCAAYYVKTRTVEVCSDEYYFTEY